MENFMSTVNNKKTENKVRKEQVLQGRNKSTINLSSLYRPADKSCKGKRRRRHDFDKF